MLVCAVRTKLLSTYSLCSSYCEKCGKEAFGDLVTLNSFDFL